MENIEGRSNDLIKTPDGRKIYWLNPIFYELPIEEAQIVQETLDEFRVLYVPSSNFHHEEIIVNRLKERLGNVHVKLEFVQSIPREPTGKFRAVISMIKDS